MADDTDDSEKTEEPTARRLQDAEEQGDIVKSQEVTTFVLLGAATLAVALFGHWCSVEFARGFRLMLAHPDQIPMNGGGVMAVARHTAWMLFVILGGPIGLLLVAGLGANILQHKPLFNVEKLAPDISKISLLSGFKRIFGMEGIANLVKGIAKMGVVGAAVWMVLWPERRHIVSVLYDSPINVAAYMIQLTLKIAMAALAVLAVIAVFDYMWQRYQFMKRNRMSRQEIKDEMRQSEGDPAIKAKVRQIRMERSRKRMMAAVPEATVVIMNPTHFAVALKYESGEMAAPVCVAKGVDALALRIRALAEESDVPVVENPPLARALYASVEIDEPVPSEHYKAVAEVIGYVMRLSGKLRQ
jgi:flagellar biosynthetic protein FlhB